ncbi:MAG: hypothetical protein ACJA0Z_003129 [Halioglobus sp.]
MRGGLPPSSRYRERVTPASVRKFKPPAADELGEQDLTVGKRKALLWAKRLKRVFQYRSEYLQRLWRSDEDCASQIVDESRTAALKMRL